MEKLVGSRLPAWTDEEAKLVKGTHDGHFFMNSYTTYFARAARKAGDCGWNCDAAAETSGYNWTSKAPVGTPSSNGWLFNYGPGLGKLANWYKNRYAGVSFVVTENGWGNASTTMEAEMEVDDLERCNYYRDYIGNLSAIAASNDIKVDAYFAWSLMDNYEWADGFSTRFGLTYVDYTTGKRTPKMSARWFQEHVTTLKELPTDGKP
jgi:beta-glucosidase/6-phospho-beta-glucosidase/beta-galactosidase